MNSYNKKKGIIYVNNQNNAKILYDFFKKNLYGIETFISISDKDYEQLNDFDNYSSENTEIYFKNIFQKYIQLFYLEIANK